MKKPKETTFHTGYSVMNKKKKLLSTFPKVLAKGQQ